MKIVTHKDRELSAQLKEGDIQAYNKLYHEYYIHLLNYALRLENDRALAEDIVQDTFVKLWTKRNQINADLLLKNYLLKICKNEFLHRIRKKKKESAFLDRIKIETTYQMFLELDNNTSRIEKLKKAIEKLPPKCKETLLLSKYENLSYKDIAEKMNISVKTVENHMAKAYDFIRSSLKLFLVF